MKQTLAITMLVGFAGTAVADPCDVRIVRAPDAIRPRIEAWIQSEQHCSRKLEVRIVESRSGFYVFARDEKGRVHERVVPDADSAGVLVASWAADDSIVPASEFDVPAMREDVTVADEPEAAATTPDEHPAREREERAQREYEAEAVERVPVAEPRATKYLSFEALFGDGGRTRGVRAELDLYAGAHWTFGVAGQISATEETSNYDGQARWHDQQITAIVARTFRGERWSARAGGGIGITHASGELWAPSGGMATATGDGAVFEWSFLVGRKVSTNWSLTAGFLVQHYAQSFVSDEPSYPTYSEMPTERSDVALSFTGGVTYAL